MKVFLTTFGCKANQHDSALLDQSLSTCGFEVTEDLSVADWVVVNTCAVTRRSEDKARQWIRKAARECPDAAIAVVGCSVEASPERFGSLPGVRLLLGTAEKFSMGRMLAEIDSTGPGPETALIEQSGAVRKEKKFEQRPVLRAQPQRSRALVKIQDGCDNCCAYCIVPYTRGGSRSRPAEQVLEEVRSLEQAGHLEAVLTGIHIGRWGMDLGTGGKKKRLDSLIEILLAGTEKIRFRLSSLEVGELTPELIGLLQGEEKRFCRHLHVPLQHGSASVLERMGRLYSPQEYLRTLSPVVERVPDIGIGADIIVGFPGETGEDFERCYDFVAAFPFTYLHVFPFSPRPGTPAAEMDEVPQRGEVRQRAKMLRELSKEKKKQFLSSLVGQRLAVVPEQALPEGVISCRAGNYARVYHRGASFREAAYEVRVEYLWRDGVWGTCPGE